MRPYRTKKYMDNLAGNKFISSCDDLAIYTGLKVRKILRELTEKEYDRELVDESDMRLIVCMRLSWKMAKSLMYMKMRLIRITKGITLNNIKPKKGKFYEIIICKRKKGTCS